MAAEEMANGSGETPFLEKVVGVGTGTRILLNKNNVVLTNSYKNLNHDLYTFDHCCVQRDEQGWFLMDLKSVPGTYLNGKRIKPSTPYRLRNGYVIFLGHPAAATTAFMYRHKETTGIGCYKHLEFEKFRLEITFERHNSNETRSSAKKEKAESAAVLIVNKRIKQDELGSTMGIQRVSCQEDKNHSSSESNTPVASTSGLPSCREQYIENNPSASGIQPSASGIQVKSDKSTNKQNPRICGADHFKFLEDNSSKVEQKAEDNSTEKLFMEECNKTNSTLLDRQNELKDLRESERVASINYVKRMLETDFTCAICTEILIKPVLLKCSHSFCRRCIWKWRRKQNRCPICRKRIIAGTENTTLDYFINTSMEALDEEFQEKRRETLLNRSKAEEDDLRDLGYSNSYVTQSFDGASPLHLPVLRHASSSHIRFTNDFAD